MEADSCEPGIMYMLKLNMSERTLLLTTSNMGNNQDNIDVTMIYSMGTLWKKAEQLCGTPTKVYQDPAAVGPALEVWVRSQRSVSILSTKTRTNNSGRTCAVGPEIGKNFPWFRSCLFHDLH